MSDTHLNYMRACSLTLSCSLSKHSWVNSILTLNPEVFCTQDLLATVLHASITSRKINGNCLVTTFYYKNYNHWRLYTVLERLSKNKQRRISRIRYLKTIWVHKTKLHPYLPSPKKNIGDMIARLLPRSSLTKKSIPLPGINTIVSTVQRNK